MFCRKQDQIEREVERMKTTVIRPGSDAAKRLAVRSSQEISREYPLSELLKRPEIDYAMLADACRLDPAVHEVAQQVEISAKYAGYIVRQQEEIERMRRFENTTLPDGFEYGAVSGLSNEVRQKLTFVRPETLAQAARVPGVTPAAISLLLIHLKRSGQLERRSA